MKRSIICLCVLTAIVTAGAVCEFVYSNRTARRIDEVSQACREASDADRRELCAALRKEFDAAEAWNELFFSKKIIDELDDMLHDLEVCAGYGDREEFDRLLGRLSFRCKSMYNAGVF